MEDRGLAQPGIVLAAGGRKCAVGEMHVSRRLCLDGGICGMYLVLLYRTAGSSGNARPI